MKRLLFAAGIVVVATPALPMPDSRLSPTCEPRLDEAPWCEQGRNPRQSPPFVAAGESPSRPPVDATAPPSPASVGPGPARGGEGADAPPDLQQGQPLLTRRISWRQLQ